ncbi:NAD-dependent epimerase/dehydratase family protein [Salipiger abyssi]|uniref:NAD-dependent epimerase/dehydratase family protein n=1 Tax=Salipiger abyssi TaxID=1250539 RepID=UPI004059D280
MAQKILVFGGDGFCGWPTALHLSALGHEIAIVDNLSRRAIDAELGTSSLTPIAGSETRLDAWEEISGRRIAFHRLDIAEDYAGLRALLDTQRPDVIVHFAEQRAAPYSMKTPATKRYTVDNNIRATHNTLVALTDLGLDCHLVHLGTMGVYGYDGFNGEIPEGYLDVKIEEPDGSWSAHDIVFPTKPGSVYHMTKSMDHLMFQFYARNDRLRITDLHQGIVWGTQTPETQRDPRLINRFDYDGDYGTVLNRFVMQAAVGYPLTVHGSGGQTRAFINIQDTTRCVALAVANPPERGERVRIYNQVAESLRVRDLAALVAELTGASVAHVDNPRKEAAENRLQVSNAGFRSLGFHPILLRDRLLEETLDIARHYKERSRCETIPARSLWTPENRPGVVKTEAASA